MKIKSLSLIFFSIFAMEIQAKDNNCSPGSECVIFTETKPREFKQEPVPSYIKGRDNKAAYVEKRVNEAPVQKPVPCSNDRCGASK